MKRPSPTNRKKGVSRRAVVLFACVWVAAAALVVTGVVVNHRAGEVASLDGHTVTRDELLFHMRRLAPTVQNELHKEYHLTGAAGWTAKAGDQTALHRLATRALDEIWRDKTTLLLAKEQGLIGSVDHADFLAELAAENKRRAKAIATGDPVYGVAEFTPEEYYSHRLTELTTGLKQRLSTDADDPLWVSDADVRRAFDVNREAWSANATTYRYSTLVVPVPAGATGAYAAGLQRRVAAAGRLAELPAREPGARLTTATYSGSAAAGSNAHDQDLVSVLSKLAPGQISAPVMGTGQIIYYELDGKAVDEAAAFAGYSRRIRQSLVDERFDKFIQRRVDGSDIKVDTAAVNAINAKDVQQ